MTRQLTFPTIGGEVVTAQQRGKHYVQPRGYIYHPGTGPEGETCQTCKHCDWGRRWAKCGLNRARHTSGRASDILVRSPACKYWEAALKDKP